MSVELVEELMRKAGTKTGLVVSVRINNKEYETGRRVRDEVKEEINIVFDEELPQWNYRVIPK